MGRYGHQQPKRGGGKELREKRAAGVKTARRPKAGTKLKDNRIISIVYKRKRKNGDTGDCLRNGPDKGLQKKRIKNFAEARARNRVLNGLCSKVRCKRQKREARGEGDEKADERRTAKRKKTKVGEDEGSRSDEEKKKNKARH